MKISAHFLHSSASSWLRFDSPSSGLGQWAGMQADNTHRQQLVVLRKSVDHFLQAGVILQHVVTLRQSFLVPPLHVICHRLLPGSTGTSNLKLFLPCLLPETTDKPNLKLFLPCTYYVTACCQKWQARQIWGSFLPCTWYITACYWKPQANEIRNYFSPARSTSLLAAWNHRQMKSEIILPLHVIHHRLLPETTGTQNLKLSLLCT